MKSHSLWLSLALLLVMGAAARAETYQAGTHYIVLQNPVATSAPGKIEVVEFFDYGCPHCFDAEPHIRRWQQSLAADVAFRKVPFLLGANSPDYRPLFYIAQELNLGDLNKAILDAIHVERKNLSTDQAADAFLASHGAQPGSATRMRRSFSVTAKVLAAEGLARSARIRGLPEMMVNGKYLVGATDTVGFPEVMQIVDFLVNKERNAQ